MHKIRGFTLVEVLIAMFIVGVLATIAISTYRTYTIRGNRIDMQQEMQSIAQQMQSYKAGNKFNYANATFAPDSNTISVINSATPSTSQYPFSSPLYTLVLTVPDQAADPAGSSWRLTATPILTANGNGILVINDQGWTCWNNPNGNIANLCSAAGSPTQTTTWSGN
jgi:type IV pilus assembly protein PilE